MLTGVEQAVTIGVAVSEQLTDLRSVPYPPEFIAGARNAVTTCLRIAPEEKVTLITDRQCQGDRSFAGA